jgi:predicted nucleic-acid-binding protein
MHSVDTNILVRLITREDERQTAIAEEYIEPGVWVSVLALAEAIWVLADIYRRDTAGVIDAVEMLLRHKSLVLESSDAVTQALEVFRSRPSLDFSDCLMLELARKAGHLPLGTFDRALGKVAGAHKL